MPRTPAPRFNSEHGKQRRKACLRRKEASDFRASGALDEDARRLLSVVRDEARRMGVLIDARGRRLTEQILTFSKPAAPEPILTALDEWLHDLLPELRALAADGIDVRVDTRGASPAVLIDPPQMQQVLSNLVLNARDAMSRGGTITIAAKTRGDTAFLMVSDEGTGMSPATAERIFEPLFTTKRRGTGLGLAVAQQIIAQHHGSIHVTSELGKGTTFTIVLPLAHADAATRTGTDE